MCVLKVYSKSYSLNEYAVQCTIPVYSIRNAREVRCKKTGDAWKENSISFDVSECDWDDFSGQVQDAILFLKTHKLALANLTTKPFISDAYLDFALWSRLDGNIINQNDHLPRELIKLCGELCIGIGMATYERQAFADEGMAEQIK